MEVREAGPDEMTRWIRAPYRFYRDQPGHRPIPEAWLRELVERDGKSLPDVRFYFAVEDDEIVGRIAVFPTRGKRDIEVAQFGFFEALPDSDEVARALVERARARARELGATRLEGPVSIHPLFSVGAMSSDFDRTAPIFIDHARPEYVSMLEAQGPSSARDLVSWRWSADVRVPAPVRQIAGATRAHAGLRVRPLNSEDFERGDARVVSELYNDAYHGTWGYQPLDAAAVSWMLRGGEAFDPRCSSVAEIDGEPAALVVALPNINEVGLAADKHEAPWAKFQERVMQAFKTTESVRVFMFCVRQAYRGRAVGGLATMMWDEFDARARDAGYTRGETPAIDAAHEHRNNALRSIGLTPGRRFRFYTYEVGDES